MCESFIGILLEVNYMHFNRPHNWWTLLRFLPFDMNIWPIPFCLQCIIFIFLKLLYRSGSIGTSLASLSTWYNGYFLGVYAPVRFHHCVGLIWEFGVLAGADNQRLELIIFQLCNFTHWFSLFFGFIALLVYQVHCVYRNVVCLNHFPLLLCV